MIKRIIPKNLKIKIHLLKNWVFDILNGYFFLYAKKRRSDTLLMKVFSITQDLKPNASKKHNLQTAQKSIESIQVNPGEIFSFWKSVGNPTFKRGFVESRSLIGGKLEKSYGGGLCQLSGLIYLISLYSGLEILERYNHSIDIYDDSTRYTPLGSDATIAYGYKDLKLKNNLKTPIKFSFLITTDKITIELNHSEKIKVNEIEFRENIVDKIKTEIVTLINDKEVDRSIYGTMKG